MRKQWIIWIVAAIVVVLAFTLRREQRAPEGAAPWAIAPADTQWVTIEGVEFPAGMEQADPVILEAYLFAAQHPEVLEYMPCYCGCEREGIGHRSNYDCFIDIIDRTGGLPRVSPDPMGFS